MIKDTLDKLTARIDGLSTVSEHKRRELAALIATLKTEVLDLSETESERAESITRFADLSTHESTRAAKNEDLQQLSLEGLSASVEGFEASHPKLVQIVNSICLTLSNLGI